MLRAPNKNERIQRYLQIKRNPVKLTALLYLRDALLNEKYEDCAEMIKVAYDFGAHDFEIRNLLEVPNRIPRG